ncbi:hypothetical protein RA28_05565 [Ruegeria sp. ANG-S4]|uniref:hypothetical protein n=1 Tax=Ruegeria sp. ANG-S4 TaxID=1577904 RepID=UPI00057CB0AB|nr:hypothetical protein [Ruegeria sp. ANG-S4]KIC47156.1 hypothetical protein RA28_05565 [Ruegeria sp. ANG-S4]
MVFFTGLPASGKSFLLRQQISISVSLGRGVHIMRWDTGLAAFQTEDLLARYPDVSDGTHPLIRKAAGLWGRRALARWLAENTDPTDMIVGEVPIIGNRFSEFIQAQPDQIEPALASEETTFIYPVPTKSLRANLEAIRRSTFANPKHPDEARDAPPSTMELAWRLTCAKAAELGLISEADSHSPYEEMIYVRFFEHLLQHRNSIRIGVDTIYSNAGSAHDLEASILELNASPDEVRCVVAEVEAAFNVEEATRDVENWYRV